MRSLAAVILLVFILGCATTDTFKVTAPEEGWNVPTISNVEVILPEGAAVDIPVGCFALGPYTQASMKPMELDILNALSTIHRSDHFSNQEPAKIVVLVRSLVNQYSNNSMYLFGCIAWCIVDGSGDILYQNQFYILSDGRVFVTPSMVKSKFNMRTAQQISNSTIAAFDQRLEESYAQVNGVYYSFDDVEPILPKTVSSVYSGPIIGSATASTDWHRAVKTDAVDWKQYLRRD